jgi:hypothetical protein
MTTEADGIFDSIRGACLSLPARFTFEKLMPISQH